MNNWSPKSWLNYPNLQHIAYEDKFLFNQIVAKLGAMPPLINSNEIITLKHEIAKAQTGDAFILQGGDCAETFANCKRSIIISKINLLLKMGSILSQEIAKPVTYIGRIAGQYAKPRSNFYETIQDTTLPSYRGDIINEFAFNERMRKPNPELLLKGYNYSALTLNYIHEHLKTNKFYTSHEALHLDYEQALTRNLSPGQNQDATWYNLSTHLPWLGLRTGNIPGAHVEYLRGIQNPLGIKIGIHTDEKWLQNILKILNPHNEKGKILLITRLGHDKVTKFLPKLIKNTQDNQLNVTWCCDPMHGNTEIAANGFKTRNFANIFQELITTLEIHNQLTSFLGGIHLELTGENVTECIGGKTKITAKDLSYAYETVLDPRLNYQQSLELADSFSQEFNFRINNNKKN